MPASKPMGLKMAACDFVLLRTVVVMIGGQRLRQGARQARVRGGITCASFESGHGRVRSHDRPAERHADERQRVVACERAPRTCRYGQLALLQLVAGEDLVAQGPP